MRRHTLLIVDNLDKWPRQVYGFQEPHLCARYRGTCSKAGRNNPGNLRTSSRFKRVYESSRDRWKGCPGGGGFRTGLLPTSPYTSDGHVCHPRFEKHILQQWVRVHTGINEHIHYNQSKPFPLLCFVLFALWCFFPGTCIACIRTATSPVLKGRPSSPIPN